VLYGMAATLLAITALAVSVAVKPAAAPIPESGRVEPAPQRHKNQRYRNPAV
jgi:hypothetical protein